MSLCCDCGILVTATAYGAVTYIQKIFAWIISILQKEPFKELLNYSLSPLLPKESGKDFTGQSGLPRPESEKNLQPAPSA
jgi:hypothetical protein